MFSKRVKIPKDEEEDPEPFTPEQMRLLLDRCSNQSKLKYMFLKDTGCRLGEMVQLRKSDILEKYSEQLGTKSTPSKKQMCKEQFHEMREETINNDALKRQVLPKLLNDCNIYEYKIGSKSIKIKKDVVEYMRDNKKILEAALNHMIASYLEKCNSSPNISTKLEEKIPRTKITQKNLQEIIDLQESCCFYCEEKGDSFAQDHFLPWNYLFQTEQYNMVPACTTCNSSKNDKLSNEKYLQKVIDRNKKLKELPMGYSEEFMRNMYENCRLEYHGSGQELWQNA